MLPIQKKTKGGRGGGQTTTLEEVKELEPFTGKVLIQVVDVIKHDST